MPPAQLPRPQSPPRSRFRRPLRDDPKLAASWAQLTRLESPGCASSAGALQPRKCSGTLQPRPAFLCSATPPRSLRDPTALMAFLYPAMPWRKWPVLPLVHVLPASPRRWPSASGVSFHCSKLKWRGHLRLHRGQFRRRASAESLAVVPPAVVPPAVGQRRPLRKRRAQRLAGLLEPTPLVVPLAVGQRRPLGKRQAQRLASLLEPAPLVVPPAVELRRPLRKQQAQRLASLLEPAPPHRATCAAWR
mmetsp:Transcript_2379/g.5862  ORF Transcript_2379/g.5862 Transcript_2379/m.5862 type:complete len:247 (-) Transcript_2379:380-1120(-)